MSVIMSILSNMSLVPFVVEGVKTKGEKYVGPNIMGQLLMSLRSNGMLDYRLPSDALAFIELLK